MLRDKIFEVIPRKFAPRAVTSARPVPERNLLLEGSRPPYTISSEGSKSACGDGEEEEEDEEDDVDEGEGESSSWLFTLLSPLLLVLAPPRPVGEHS